MPSYTDPVSGIRIRTDGPLSPEELDAAFAPTPENIRRYAMNEGRKLGIPAATAVAVIGQESGGDVNAVSPKGARGAAQVMPDTAAMIQRQYGIDMEDPFGRVKGGLLYLRDQYREFGDPTLALAAYNAGPGAVREYGGVPPYPETQQYVASIPTAGWGRPLDEKTNGPSTMPLMSDTLDPVDRTPRDKAVNIPDAASLVASYAGAEREQLPWYQRIPQRMMEPPVELGVQAVRAATGSQLPPVPTDRLVTDAVQTAGLLASATPIGRVGSAAIQGLSGAASAMQDAAERHATAGSSWSDQVAALDPADKLNLGLQVATGMTLGAMFPGTKPKAKSAYGGIAQAREDLGSMMARDTVQREMMTTPQSAITDAAFGKVNGGQVVDAAAWREAVIAHRAAGKSVPSEVAAIFDRLQPEMREVVKNPGVRLPAGVGAESGLRAVPVDVALEPTGRYLTTAGELLQANKALGSMINTPAAKQTGEVLGHTVGNLNALRKDLTSALSSALPEGQRTLYEAARATSKDMARDRAAMTFVEKYMIPDREILNGKGMLEALTGTGRTRLVKAMGFARFQRLETFAKSVATIAKNPERQALLSRALTVRDLVGAVAGGGGGYAAFGPAGVAAAVAPAVLLGIATSPVALRALDVVARAPLYSRTFTSALGELSASRTLLAGKIQSEMRPPAGDRYLLPVDQ